MKHRLRKKLTGLIDEGSFGFERVYKGFKHTFQRNSPGIDSDLQDYFDCLMAYEVFEDLGLHIKANEHFQESERIKRKIFSSAKKLRKAIYTNVLK